MSSLSLAPIVCCDSIGFRDALSVWGLLVGLTGLEPVTSSLSGTRSNRLS